jgi:hypothetical protein
MYVIVVISLIKLADTIQLLVRQSVVLEALMVSYLRVNNLCEIPP